MTATIAGVPENITADTIFGPAARYLAGADRRLLLVADHAANQVPRGLDLGVPENVMADHVAIDIGVGPLTERLAAVLDAPAWIASFSRLVCDVNRPQDSPALAPERSDGILIPGNRNLSPEARAERETIHQAFHTGLARHIARQRPALIISVHSFTPSLKSDPAVSRPWPVAVLWNRDDRAARIALETLAADGRFTGPVGANEPYSGRILNYTMDRHAEAGGFPYLGFEVRQDGIADAAGVAHWADILADTIRNAVQRFAIA